MKNQKKFKGATMKIVIPVFVSMFIISGCSQSQVEGGDKLGAGGSVTSNVKKGPTSGTIGDNGSSNVNSREVDGSNSNFAYLPNHGLNANTSDITLAGLKDPNNLLSQRVIYFDYDKSTIRPEFLVLINTHAKLAAKFPNLKMRLEGHADERGSREYNVALSAQRAQSVKSLMGAQGARSSQIRTIGYGEEVPIEGGQGERSWQKNRRVEIKYDGGY